MNRKAILDRIRIEPQTPECREMNTWTFYVTERRPRHGATVVVRRMWIGFMPASREFVGGGQRRVSKRKKRKPVAISQGMIDHLRTLLPPPDLARCIALSLARPAATSGAAVPPVSFNVKVDTKHLVDSLRLVHQGVDAYARKMRALRSS